MSYDYEPYVVAWKKALRCLKQCVELVYPAQVPGIANDKFPSQFPALAQLVHFVSQRRDCLTVRPVVDDRQPLARYTFTSETFRHSRSDSYHMICLYQRRISLAAQHGA